MRVLLVAALLLPLSGCASSPSRCGPSDHAQWMELGLYAALEGRGSAYGNSANLGSGSFAIPNSTVFGVDWSPSFRGHVSIVAPPVAAATLQLDAGTDDATFRAIARSFFENVSADPSSWDGWIESLHAQWRAPPTTSQAVPGQPQPPGAGGVVAIHGPYRWEALAREQTMTVNASESATTGWAHLSGGAWDLTLQLPSREWTQGGVTLRADPRGVNMAFVEGENHTTSLQRTDALLRQLGLPPSGMSPGSFTTFGC